MKTDYDRIANAIEYIRSNFEKQPTLEQMAFHANLTPFHFNRIFRKWVGISPKRYLEEITLDRAKFLLKSRSVLEASLGVGLTGPSRLHDHFVALEGLSPGEFREQGKSVELNMGFAASPFGDMLVVSTKRGIHGMAFVDDKISREKEKERFIKLLPFAKAVYDDAQAKSILTFVFKTHNKELNHEHANKLSGIYLSVRGTNFQIQVWRALLSIPYGQTVTYQHIADSINKSDAVRAVANAIAANPVHFIIPCHRVVRSDGSTGGYRGGEIRKEILLRYEKIK